MLLSVTKVEPNEDGTKFKVFLSNMLQVTVDRADAERIASDPKVARDFLGRWSK
jgi:hypothetical protein